jgi:glycogenin glucosyltransferase
MECGYFTMASDEFVPGAVCLIKSLRKFTNKPINVLNLSLSKSNRQLLENYGVSIHDVPRLSSIQARTQPWHTNPEFANNCFNKIHLWNRNYDKLIYLDSDILVMKDIDHLFELEHAFSACSSFAIYKDNDIKYCGWSADLFNAGVLVLKPDILVFADLMEKKDVVYCPNDPSDQGLLNFYYKNRWNRLKPIYNFTRRVFDTVPQKWKEWREEICIIHYTLDKPWNKKLDSEIDKLWWECYND